jgi:uncharacterized SAM-binding protein YcdF (DUF218 family)
MHLLGQVAGGVLGSPLALASLLGILAAVAGLLGWRRTRAWLCVLGVSIAYFASVIPVSDWLLGPLERQYPPPAYESLPRVGYIVVLGSSFSPSRGIPVTGALDEDGLARIVEGVRLVRKLGGAQLVVSGGAPPGRAAPADGYAQLARDLGIPQDSIVVLDKALDTAQEARAIAQRLGHSPFLLVTSASHMPRALEQMTRAGAVAIAAPTAELTGRPLNWTAWIPSASGLKRTEHALHEYLGLLALKIGVV